MKLEKTGRLCAFGICLLAVTGCSVGPDFRKPQPAVPAEWHGKDASASYTEVSATPEQGYDLARWWKAFEDPVLDSLIERAIASNLDLRQAEARIRQARAAQGVTAAGLWPTVNSSASFTQSAGGSTSSVANNTVRDLFQIGLDASWELDFFGGTRRNIEAARADLKAAVEDRRDVLVTLISDVGNSYANLRQFQTQIDIARKNLVAQERTAEITRKRHDAGFVSGLDVANAQAQVATTESQIPVLEASASGEIFRLGVLLGLQPAALAEELSPAKPILPTPPEVPVGIPSDLLRRRPDIRRSEAQLHAATARIGVATADLFPRFSLTGNFGTLGQDLVSLGNLSNRFWSWGPTVTWPIFDAGRIRWNIEVQNALQEQALLVYERAILVALQDVETALVAYGKEFSHNRLLGEAVANNRRAVDLAMQLYTNGRTDFLNVITAQRSLYASEEALAQSTNALITNLIALYKALGGGWDESDKHKRAGGGVVSPPFLKGDVGGF